jgi:hypothetical protein
MKAAEAVADEGSSLCIMRWRLMSEKNVSTAFSQKPDVGVKWNGPVWMPREPGLHVRMLVGGVVVDDGLDDPARWHCPLGGIEEANELLIGAACSGRLRCLPAHIQYREQRRASDRHACHGFGLCVRRQRQRDTHDYPPSADLLLMMTFAGVFDVDRRLIHSEVAG